MNLNTISLRALVGNANKGKAITWREKEGLALYRGEHAHMDDILTDDSFLFSFARKLFLCHPGDAGSRARITIHMDVYECKVHVDDLSNYFVHTLFLQSMCVSDSLIHLDAYKCLVHVDDSSIFSSNAIFLHPCAFVSRSSTWMHKNVTMWMIRRTISSTTLFLHRCGFVILSSTWMHTNVTPCG
jgi:hypothetical protein